MRLASAWENLLLLLLGAAIAALPYWGQPYHVTLANKALVAGMFALSLQLLVGATGLVALGHAGFFAIGAYVVVWLSPSGSPGSLAVTLPVAILLAALVALPVGALSLRTRGFFFLMVTLAFGQMIFFVFHDTPLGISKDGVFVARPVIEAFGWRWNVSRREWPNAMLWLNLGLVVAVYGLLLALMRTMFGHALQGIRENEPRMRALGHDTTAIKLMAFVIAAALAGTAGHMAAMTEAFVSPELAAWHHGAEALLMILLGGLSALHGPLLGAAALVGLEEVAQLLTERQRLIEGLVILLVVLVLPSGLAGLLRR